VVSYLVLFEIGELPIVGDLKTDQKIVGVRRGPDQFVELE
jgi:hypothetical protein